MDNAQSGCVGAVSPPLKLNGHDEKRLGGVCGGVIGGVNLVSGEPLAFRLTNSRLKVIYWFFKSGQAFSKPVYVP